MTPLKLKYRFAMEDSDAYQRWFMANDKKFKRKLLLLPGSMSLVLLAFAAICASDAKWHSMRVYLGAAVLMFPVFPFVVRRLALRNVRKRYSKPEYAALFGEKEIELREDGLLRVDASGRAETPFSAIPRVVKTDALGMIHHPAETVTVVPRRGIFEGDYDAFFDALAAKLSTKNG